MKPSFVHGLLTISFFSLLLTSFQSFAVQQYEYTIIHNLIPGVHYSSHALTINNHGAVGGYYLVRPERFTGLSNQDETPRKPVGFIYRPSTGIEVFNGPSEQKGIEIIDLNDSGQFIGRYNERYIKDDNGFTYVGHRYSYFIQRGSEREDLALFDPALLLNSSIYAVLNNNGEVAGIISGDRGNLKTSVGILSPNGVLTDVLSGVTDCDQAVADECSRNNLLDFDYWTSFEALDMNDFGQVAFVLRGASTSSAYVFKPGEGIKLLLNTTTQLNQISINNQGITLVGRATDAFYNWPDHASQTWLFSPDGVEQTLVGGVDTSSWHLHTINNTNVALGYERVAFSLTDAAQVSDDSTFPVLWDGAVGGNSLRLEGYEDINDSNAIIVKTWDGNIKFKAVVMTPITDSGASITIDGNFEDWADQDVFTDSNTDGGIVNWNQVWTEDSGENLFFSYTDTNLIDEGALYLRNLYLDTDKNAGTGYNFDLLGGDFLLQGKSLYQYTGTGQDWSWEYKQEVDYAVSGKRAEFSIAKSLLDLSADATSYRALFYGYDSDGSNLDYILIERGLGTGNIIAEEITIPSE